MYDLVGKIKQVTDPTGTYGFAYDNMGRLIGKTMQYSFLPGFNYTNSYGYDAASNRTSLTAPDGSITTYGYDTLNRLNGLSNSWAGSFGFGYDALNRRTSLTRPNGVNTSYSYDSLSHLLSVLHQTGTTTLDGASYTYDAAGNRKTKTNYLDGVTSNYGYDLLYQLTQVTQGASTTESYTYDAVGNRLSSLGVPNYNYNASNELTSTTSGSYTYDNNGNTLTDASGKSYTWDFENRMAQAVVPGTNGGTTTFRYDPFRRRTQKASPSGTTNYLFDGSNLIQELTSTGSLSGSYLGDDQVDKPLALLRGSAVDFYHSDALGSITSLSNANAQLVTTYTYGAYGFVTASTGAIADPFRYTGRDFDSETALLNLRARYFDPTVGRFLSEDPLRFSSSVNFYEYVFNNPVRYSDPFGLDVTVTLWPGAYGFGHIGVGVNTADTVGFYPTEHKACLVTGCTVPGVILDDQQQHPGIRPRILVIHTTPDQDRAMQTVIDDRRNANGNYQLYDRNCARFVEDVLGAGGLNPLDTTYPRDLFNNLEHRFPNGNNAPTH